MVFLSKLTIILQNWYTVLWIAPEVNGFGVYINSFFDVSPESFQVFGEFVEVFIGEDDV